MTWRTIPAAQNPAITKVTSPDRRELQGRHGMDPRVKPEDDEGAG